MSINAPIDANSIVDFETYPDAASTPGQSYDVEKGAFSIIGESPYLPIATAVNDMGESAVGLPRNQATTLNLEKNELTNLSTEIFPLPFKNEINISVILNTPIIASVKIINTIGKTIYNEQKQVLNGEIKIKNLDNFSSGLYILNVPELNINKKIIKN